ncbi:MAG: FkbM family methyltransferase [Hyphomicrobium sp.]|nr:MAG: FkbM family methyltransferase [Hyphomicrobium sp.]MBZ0211495.1 FkbM family methyltransferase [Hyphomicrobium sp.]
MTATAIPHISPELIGQLAPLGMTIMLGGRVIRVSAQRAERIAFWHKAESGAWEDCTLRFVKDTTDRETTFIDIGAWIGPIAVVAGALAKRVIAVEPDPVAASELEENVALNNAPVEVWRAGIDTGSGSLKLFAKTGFGGSMTSSLGDPSSESISVATVSFDDITAAITSRAGNAGRVVLKMDVEGHEFTVGEQLVAFARKHRAPMNLSLHPAIFYRAARRTEGPLAARLQTFLATKTLLDRLASYGRVRVSKTGQPLTLPLLASFVFLRRRPKNFSVDVFPDSRNMAPRFQRSPQRRAARR